jgi:hypothetical protein
MVETKLNKAALKTELNVRVMKMCSNIKTDLREIGWSGVHWINLAQDRDRWTVL